jgi:hypothetical protein
MSGLRVIRLTEAPRRCDFIAVGWLSEAVGADTAEVVSHPTNEVEPVRLAFPTGETP